MCRCTEEEMEGFLMPTSPPEATNCCITGISLTRGLVSQDHLLLEASVTSVATERGTSNCLSERNVPTKPCGPALLPQLCWKGQLMKEFASHLLKPDNLRVHREDPLSDSVYQHSEILILLAGSRSDFFQVTTIPRS